MAEPGAAPHSQIRVTYKGVEQSLSIHEMSRDQVQGFLEQHPTSVVIRAPSARALQSDPTAVAVVSFRNPYSGEDHHLTVSQEWLDNMDIFSGIQEAIASIDMFGDLVTYIPVQGGRRRKNRKNKKTRKGKAKKSRKTRAKKSWGRRRF